MKNRMHLNILSCTNNGGYNILRLFVASNFPSPPKKRGVIINNDLSLHLKLLEIIAWC